VSAGRAVVVGGAGFVGTAVCQRFHDEGYDVLALCRRPDERPVPWRHTVVDPLAVAPQELGELLRAQAPTVVVNAAGAVWSCTPEQMRRLNLDLVRRLLSGLRRLPRPPRLVQLGSVHEYGSQPTGTRLVESLPPKPVTPYGRTKLAGTRAVLAAAATGRVPGVVLRLTNVLGAGAPEVSLAGRVARELANAARAGDPATLTLSPLNAERDFVDARDAAEAALLAAREPVVGQLVNVGGGQPVPVRTLVQRLVALSGVPATVVETGTQESTRSLNLDWQDADTQAAKELLGWQPRYTLDDSLLHLWQSVAP
jgi:dTDP-6-deoxy-L-talose 4-dehydrogenase [NAD(P)+]